MNGALEHEGRPPFRYNSRGSTPQRRDSSAVRVTCWDCGQRGHYSNECPNTPTDRKHQPSAGQSTTMGHTLPTAQTNATHQKAGAAGHYGGQLCRSNQGPDQTAPGQSHPTHPTHLPAHPLSMFWHPNSPKKEITLPGHRWSQSDRQNRLHAHHSFIYRRHRPSRILLSSVPFPVPSHTQNTTHHTHGKESFCSNRKFCKR